MGVVGGLVYAWGWFGVVWVLRGGLWGVLVIWFQLVEWWAVSVRWSAVGIRWTWRPDMDEIRLDAARDL